MWILNSNRMCRLIFLTNIKNLYNKTWLNLENFFGFLILIFPSYKSCLLISFVFLYLLMMFSDKTLPDKSTLFCSWIEVHCKYWSLLFVFSKLWNSSYETSTTFLIQSLWWCLHLGIYLAISAAFFHSFSKNRKSNQNIIISSNMSTFACNCEIFTHCYSPPRLQNMFYTLFVCFYHHLQYMQLYIHFYWYQSNHHYKTLII